MKLDIIRFREVDSTNNIAKKLAGDGAKEWTVLVADKQTSGRGRLGRSFVSPEATGLYMSIILRPKASPKDAVLITAAAAVAVAEAIDHVTGGYSQIKWVNDIYRNGKKVAGILTEGNLNTETGKLDYAILGIGVNIKEPNGGFPPEISDIAGALLKTETEIGDIKEKLLARIASNFAEIYPKLSGKEYIAQYRERSMLKNAEINVLKSDSVIPAKVLGIDDDCGLVVQYQDGRTETLTSGDVSVRIMK